MNSLVCIGESHRVHVKFLFLNVNFVLLKGSDHHDA